jgi:hypothetical protein
LKTFVWDLRGYDRLSDSWDDFAQPQVDWLRSFVTLARAQNSLLSMITIVFEPKYCSAPCSREEYARTGYPWDLMKVLKKQLWKMGIELTWTKPYLTKEDMARRIAEFESCFAEPR